jgi:carbonic anhydrase
MEYACAVVKSKLIIVLGHTKCGAIISACNNVKTGHLTGLLSKIKPAIDKEVTTRVARTGQNLSFVTNVSIINVRLIINQIMQQSTILNKLEKEGRILIVGGLYDIDSGEVTFFDSIK